MSTFRILDTNLDQWIQGTNYSMTAIACEMDVPHITSHVVSYTNMTMWSIPATKHAVRGYDGSLP
jgi:hypothetical protein